MSTSRFVSIQVLAEPPFRFTISLDRLIQKIENWPGLYVEWDGSFVWSIRNEENHSIGQIDGMVYDRDGAIESLELKGTAPRCYWEQILSQLNEDVEGTPTNCIACRFYDLQLRQFRPLQDILKNLE